MELVSVVGEAVEWLSCKQGVFELVKPVGLVRLFFDRELRPITPNKPVAVTRI